MSLENRSGTPVNNIPVIRQNDYYRERAALAQYFPNAENAIRQDMNAFVDGRFSQCGWTLRAEFCSSWIPGQDWNTGPGNGVYQPIFDTMMMLYGDDRVAHQRAGWFFGLLLMDAMIHRDDTWEFWREPHQPEDDPEGFHYRPKSNKE